MDDQLEHQLVTWVRETRQGNSGSYQSLLSEVVKLLRPYFQRRLDKKELAEDLVQETLLSIHRFLHTYNDQRRFGPWLYGVAKHRWVDAMRKLRRIEKNEVLDDSRMIEVWSAATQNDEIKKLDLDEVLALLTPKQRQVIELLKISGLSVKEVAAKTGLSVSDVKVTAFRGYSALRRYFGVTSENK